jgi:hypothetical protein
LKTFSRVLVFLIAGLVMFPGVNAQKISESQCVQQLNLEPGLRCNKKSSWQLTVQNRCSEPIDVRYCLRNGRGTWNFSTDLGLKAGAKSTHYVCDGNGEAWTTSKLRSSSHKLPHPDEGRAKVTSSDRATACSQLKEMTNSGECECRDVGPKVQCLGAPMPAANAGAISAAKQMLRERFEREREALCLRNPGNKRCKPGKSDPGGIRG